MRHTLPVAVLVLTLAAGAVHATEPIPPYIEAWCDGGIDGRYQHATVDPYGTIRATDKRDVERPWPEVAKDIEAAQRWFAALEAAEPAGPPALDDITAADQIYCGLELNKGQESVRYDLPEILREIVVYVPGYH